jgi:hypothetical protein
MADTIIGSFFQILLPKGQLSFSSLSACGIVKRYLAAGNRERERRR